MKEILLEAVYKATARLRGAYALGVVCKDNATMN